MKIERKIERRIEVTPGDLYAALAARYDLPSVASGSVWFDADSFDMSHITVVAVEHYTQDLDDGS